MTDIPNSNKRKYKVSINSDIIRRTLNMYIKGRLYPDSRLKSSIFIMIFHNVILCNLYENLLLFVVKNVF